MNIETIIRDTLINGGGTFLNGRNISEELSGVFVVGGRVPSSVIDFTDTGAVADSVSELMNNHSVIGTWFHEGKIHLDVVDIIHDREEAIELGKERGEIAIWDVDANTEIVLQ